MKIKVADTNRNETYTRLEALHIVCSGLASLIDLTKKEAQDYYIKAVKTAFEILRIDFDEVGTKQYNEERIILIVDLTKKFACVDSDYRGAVRAILSGRFIYMM